MAAIGPGQSSETRQWQREAASAAVKGPLLLGGPDVIRMSLCQRVVLSADRGIQGQFW